MGGLDFGFSAPPRAETSGGGEVLPLQSQALEIIDEILAGSAPEEAEARASLRRQVARNPGRPERALLAHMMGIR